VFKRNNNFGSVFPNLLEGRIYQIKFPTCVSFLFFFLFSISRVTFLFPSDAQNLPFIRDCKQWHHVTGLLLTAGLEIQTAT